MPQQQCGAALIRSGEWLLIPRGKGQESGVGGCSSGTRVGDDGKRTGPERPLRGLLAVGSLASRDEGLGRRVWQQD